MSIDVNRFMIAKLIMIEYMLQSRIFKLYARVSTHEINL